jgi:hypothetical protein
MHRHELMSQLGSDGRASGQLEHGSGGRAGSLREPKAPPGEEARPSERRRRRSDDPITALHYQLSTTRSEACLDAVVLVDDSGCLVAGAGAWPACEELAAYAPLLANPDAIQSGTVGSRIAALTAEVAVQSLSVEGVEVLLCGRGGTPERGASISRAAAGCLRILRAAA